MKYVDDYWVEVLPNGVYHLLFNLKERGCYYHMYTNNWYLIASTEEEYDNMSKDCVVKIESFLPSLEKGVYVPSSILEKDQLSFYFIPCLFEWSKSRKERIILNVSNENN